MSDDPTNGIRPDPAPDASPVAPGPPAAPELPYRDARSDARREDLQRTELSRGGARPPQFLTLVLGLVLLPVGIMTWRHSGAALFYSIGLIVVGLIVFLARRRPKVVTPADPPRSAYGFDHVYPRLLPTAEELAAARKILDRSAPKRSRWPAVTRWLVIVGIAVVIFISMRHSSRRDVLEDPEDQPEPRPAWLTPAGVAACFSPIAYLLVFTVAARWRRKRTPTLLTGWTEEGLVDGRDGAAILSKWVTYKDLLDAPEMYILRLKPDERQGLVIPKRGFPDVAARLSFLAAAGRDLAYREVPG